MGDVGASLTRKLGPLPVWAWAGIVGIALYWYRQRHAARSGGVPTGADTQAQALASVQPQTPQVLAPGESVYDPNTGVLTSGGNGNSLAPSIIGLIAALLQPKPAGRHPHTKRKHHHVRKRHHRRTHHAHHPGKHPGKSHHHPKHGAGTRHHSRKAH